MAITKQSLNPMAGVTHYTVTPARNMPLKEFLRLLEALKSIAQRSFAIGSR